MFDMFGESVPSPLASIEFPEGTTSDSEKKGWELELLGVAFSGTKRLDIAAAGGKANGVMSRGQITAAMSGSKVTLTGQIASTTKRSPKTGKPYLIATLALLDGEIDVFVWDNILNSHSDVWNHGTLIEVVGTVRSKNSELSISCSSAKVYDLSNGSDSEENQHNSSQGEKPKPNQSITSQNGNPTTATPNITNRVINNTEPSKLIIFLKESVNQSKDRNLLKSIASLCAEFKGNSKIEFHILTQNKTVVMEWPIIKVDISNIFKKKIENLLGDFGYINTN